MSLEILLAPIHALLAWPYIVTLSSKAWRCGDTQESSVLSRQNINRITMNVVCVVNNDRLKLRTTRRGYEAQVVVDGNGIDDLKMTL